MRRRDKEREGIVKRDLESKEEKMKNRKKKGRK
jgi:hypothetical protein